MVRLVAQNFGFGLLIHAIHGVDANDRCKLGWTRGETESQSESSLPPATVACQDHFGEVEGGVDRGGENLREVFLQPGED